MTTQLARRPTVFDVQCTASPEWVMALFLQGKKSTSIATRLYGLKRFAKYAGCKTPLEACTKLVDCGKQGAQMIVDLWRSRMYDAGVAPETINVCLQSVRRFVALCNRYGATDWTLDVPGVAVDPYRKTHGCGFDGWKRLSAHLSSIDDWAGRRDYALVCLMWDLAMRRSEVWALDLASIDFGQKLISIKGKGREQTAQYPLPAPTIKAIERWIEVRGPGEGPLFIRHPGAHQGFGRLDRGSIYRIINRRGKEAGLDSLHPHALRHAVCTHLLLKGNQVLDVMEFMRHRKVDTTMRYFKNVDGAGTRMAKLASACR